MANRAVRGTFEFPKPQHTNARRAVTVPAGLLRPRSGYPSGRHLEAVQPLQPLSQSVPTGAVLVHHPSLCSVWSAPTVLHACCGGLRLPLALPDPGQIHHLQTADSKRRTINGRRRRLAALVDALAESGRPAWCGRPPSTLHRRHRHHQHTERLERGDRIWQAIPDRRSGLTGTPTAAASARLPWSCGRPSATCSPVACRGRA